MAQETPEKPAIAVALQEAPDDATPTVVATGRGKAAEQILNIAFANGVKVREDADYAGAGRARTVFGRDLD